MSLRLKAYQVMIVMSSKLPALGSNETMELENSWQSLSGECSKSWLEHSCHLLSIRNFTAVLSPQKIAYVLERHENIGMLSCGYQTAFLILQFTLRSSSWRQNKSLWSKAGCGSQCISCAEERQHAPVWWMSAKTQGRSSP